VTRSSRNRWVGRAVLGAGIAWALWNRNAFDAQGVRAWLDQLGVWAPIGFVAAYAVLVLLFVPGSVLTMAGGVVFGPIAGTLLSLTGATLGSGLAFLTARYLSADWAARRAGAHLERFLEGVAAEGWRFVAFVRLVPLFPFNLTNYALGLTRIRLWPYVAASFVCMLPGTAAYSYLGYSGGAALSGSHEALRSGLIALAFMATIAFFVPLFVKRRRSGAIQVRKPPRDLDPSDDPHVIKDGAA